MIGRVLPFEGDISLRHLVRVPVSTRLELEQVWRTVWASDLGKCSTVIRWDILGELSFEVSVSEVSTASDVFGMAQRLSAEFDSLLLSIDEEIKRAAQRIAGTTAPTLAVSLPVHAEALEKRLGCKVRKVPE